MNSDPLSITDRHAVLELMSRMHSGRARMIDCADMNASLKDRIRGQDHVVDQVCTTIRQQYGKHSRKRPVANLFFVGPPATGKTELAKALAEYLFEDERHMLRFDCSELSGPEGKTRLIGTPTGYVGADQGGQLTRPMLSNSRRLILFDEIEKAYDGIFDLFLSMLDEGRLTEQGSNKVADFTESVIVITSNAQHDELSTLSEQIDDPAELNRSAKTVLRDSKVFRPELVSRFDSIYVFKPLSGIVNAEIAAIKITNAAREYGVELEFVAPQIVYSIMRQADSAQDTRELARAVDAELGELFLRVRELHVAVPLRVDADVTGVPFVEINGKRVSA